MKNKLSDLNDALFAQLERLGNEELDAERLTTEIQRTEAVVALSDRIVDMARLQLDAAKFVAGSTGDGKRALPATLALTGKSEASS